MRKQALLAILMVFLAMGFGDVVGPMVSLAKESFSLSNTAIAFCRFSNVWLTFCAGWDFSGQKG